MDSYASTADVRTAHPYIQDAGRKVFEVPVATATENQLLTASFIGDENNLRNVVWDYRLWQYSQQLPAETYTTESIQDGLDFAQDIYNHNFQSERPNQYASALAERLVVSGGGGFSDRGALANGVGIAGTIGLNSELIKISKQYINGGMDPRIVLNNAIATRDSLVRRGASQKLINKLNIQIGQMTQDLRRNPVFEW